MKILHIIAFILLVVGGLNWGLMGLGSLISNSDWNIVHMILGSSMMLENIVYVLVGIAAVWLLVTHKSACRECTM